MALLCLVAGCWDRVEIGDRLYVFSLVVDRPQEGQGPEPGKAPAPKPLLYRVGIEVSLWKQLRGGMTGAGGGAVGGAGKGGGLTPEKPAWVMASAADTVAKALDQLHKRTFRVVSLSHLKVVIQGEAQARRGIDGVLDFLERHPAVQRRVNMTVAPGEGLDLLQANPPIDQLVARALPMLLGETATAPYSVDVNLGDVISKHHAKASYLIPRVRRTQDGLVLGGAGVFRHDRLTGWLGEEECAGYNWITGRVKEQVLQYRLPGAEGSDAYQVIRLRSGRRRLTLAMAGGRPVFRLSVAAAGDLEESPVALDSPEEVRQVNREAARALRRQIEQALAAQRRLKAEFCGFGELVRERQPRLWDKVKDRWDEYFAKEARVDVSVRVKLRFHGEIR